MPGRAQRPSALHEAFTARLPYKAAALLFAVLLWLLASFEEPTTVTLAVRLTPIGDSAARVVGRPPTVRATFAGPARELLALYQRPPVLRRALGDEAPGDSVRLDLRPGDVDLPSGVTGVTVRDVRPRTLWLRVARPTAAAAVRVPNATPAPDSAPAAPDSVPPAP